MNERRRFPHILYVLCLFDSRNNSVFRVKIGITGDMKRRYQVITQTSPDVCEVRFCAAIDSSWNASVVECLLHHRFAEQATNNEWFYIPPEEAVQEMRQICAKRHIGYEEIPFETPKDRRLRRPLERGGHRLESTP
jgi:hypothetical protein